jgi:hypothetical protein
MLLSTLPHIINWFRDGEAGYIADADGLLYLAWSRDIVRHGSLSMTDAIHRPSGPMMHAWILFVPEGWLAHLLGGTMTILGIVWRVLAGIILPIALFYAVRPFTKTAKGAAALAAFLFFDTGLLGGQLLQRNLEIYRDLATGHGGFFNGVPRVLAHLRAPTPALALPFLLLFFRTLDRARRLGTNSSLRVAGIALGFLFHSYFYFATTAFCAMALYWLIDREHRKAIGTILVIGILVAAPAVIMGAWVKGHTSADWLLRTNKFVSVDRFDRAHFLFPRVLMAQWLITTWFVFAKRRDLLYLWLFTGVALILLNQHLITGLDVENFHWSYAYGVSFSLLISLLVLPLLKRIPQWKLVMATVVVLHVLVGFGLRGLETTRSAETNQYRSLLADWKEEGLSLRAQSVVAGPVDLMLVLAGTEDIDPLDCHLVEYSSLATDAERDARLVLNAILTGRPPRETIDQGEHVNELVRARRLRLFDELAIDLNHAIDRFAVSHVIVPVGQSLPTSLAGRARFIKKGRRWELWTIDRQPITTLR